MRKLRLLIVLTLIAFSSFAQEHKAPGSYSPTHKNNILMGANVMLMMEPDEFSPVPGAQQYHSAVSPHFGYFISDNLLLGIDQTIISERIDQYRSKTRHKTIGVFGRYYIGKASGKNGSINKIRFFTEAGVEYGLFNHAADDYSWTNNVLDLRVMPSVDYFINTHIALEFGLNGTFEFPDAGKQGRFVYSPGIGLEFFVGRR